MDQHDPAVLGAALLAVAGLGVRDIFGFTAITCLVTGIVFGATMLLLGAG